MRSNSFPFVLSPLRRSLCLFCAKPTQRARPEVEGGKEGLRDRESQLTKEGRREQSACRGGHSRQKEAEKMEARQRRESTEVRKTTVKIY